MKTHASRVIAQSTDHVATCSHCGAIVIIGEDLFNKTPNGENELHVLDREVKCCDKPDYCFHGATIVDSW